MMAIETCAILYTGYLHITNSKWVKPGHIFLSPPATHNFHRIIVPRHHTGIIGPPMEKNKQQN